MIAMHYLGKNLRHLRKQSARTQSEIASLIQKGQTTIGNWENGISEPSLNELLIISNYFDIPIDALLKVDLAEIHSPTPHRKDIKPYQHADKEPLGTEEPAGNWSYMLKEIKDMQQKIEDLYARLPKETAPRSPNDQISPNEQTSPGDPTSLNDHNSSSPDQRNIPPTT